MSLSPQIRAILLAGAKSVDDIAELISETPKVVQTALHALKFQGKVRYKDVDGRRLYSIADWPEKAAAKAAPPPRRAGKKAKALRARSAEATPTPANGSSAEEFAITDTGVLAIKQGNVAIQIHPEAFTRLRKFIDRAESIFNPTE